MFTFEVNPEPEDPDPACSVCDVLPPGLEVLCAPGFFGEIRARVAARDFQDEEFSVLDSDSFLFDNNDVPTVEIVGVDLREPASGVIPIRYRLLDPDLNPAEVLVEFDPGDGIFRRANEFPATPSEDVSGRCTLDPQNPLDTGACEADRHPAEHVFLWDSVSQLQSSTDVRIRLQAEDRECTQRTDACSRSVFRLGPLNLSPLENAGSLAVVDVSGTPVKGDFDGDGRLDVVVAAGSFVDNVTLLRQRFLLPHANAFYDPQDPSTFPDLLVDPRLLTGYQLQLPDAPFDRGTQVCVVPDVAFALPHGDAFQRGKSLTNVTDTVAILRERTRIRREATLTLRLRDHENSLRTAAIDTPGRLRVFRKNPDTGVGEALHLSAGDIEIVDFADGKGVRFPITRFGSYVVSIELDR